MLETQCLYERYQVILLLLVGPQHLPQLWPQRQDHGRLQTVYGEKGSVRCVVLRPVNPRITHSRTLFYSRSNSQTVTQTLTPTLTPTLTLMPTLMLTLTLTLTSIELRTMSLIN